MPAVSESLPIYGQVGGEILCYMTWFSWTLRLTPKLKSKTQREWSREFSAIQKTTFLLALTQSESSRAPVSPHCTDPLLQEYPCSHSLRIPCSKNMPFPDTQVSESLLETFGDRSLLPWFLHFLGSLSTAEKLLFQVPLATWTKPKSSQGGAQPALSSLLEHKEGWAMGDLSHTVQPSPHLNGSLCIPKPPQAGQARSKGSQNHQHLSSACKGSSSNTNRCTGDNSCWSGCFPPGNLLSYVWA